MNSEVLVKDLIPYLPHRAPMVWVDRVAEVGKDYKGLAGTCVVKLDPQALYMGAEGRLRGSAAIEFTAQGFGYLKAAYQVLHKINNPPSKTYLTGVRSCQADFSDFKVENGKELEVRISVLREILPLTYLRGEIFERHSDQSMGYAEIQVYVD